MQEDNLKDETANSTNTVLYEGCPTTFGQIEQGKFFIDGEEKLCRFGCYGMGIGINGTIAKKFTDDTAVRATFI